MIRNSTPDKANPQNFKYSPHILAVALIFAQLAGGNGVRGCGKQFMQKYNYSKVSLRNSIIKNSMQIQLSDQSS